MLLCARFGFLDESCALRDVDPFSVCHGALEKGHNLTHNRFLNVH